MLFTSMEFLFVFLVITMGVNYLLPTFARNYWLFLTSLFFYAWGEPGYIFLMLLSIAISYFGALRIEELGRGTTKSKWMLAFLVCVDLLILGVYKYANFITKTLSEAFPNGDIQVTEFILPIGISFFTFQAISYVIDVYRGTEAQKNFCFVGLYISLFPQLIAGPIVRYTTIEKQIIRRSVTWEQFSRGVFRFVRGFNKKMLLANILSQVADKAFITPSLSVAMAWLGALCYSLQIFFDFCGYSDMAIGLGQMLGFHFLENFNYPYISKTVTEFWRRWHISLGSWFRDYIYFPMGGSRVKTRLRLVFNLLVVWLATGIWHGANWTFLVWGLLHGAAVTVEKLCGIPQRSRDHRVFSLAYQGFTLLLVMFGWVLFRAEDLTSGMVYLRTMLGLCGKAITDSLFWFNLREYAVFIAAGLLCATPLLGMVRGKLTERNDALGHVCTGTACVVQFVLFLIGVSALVIKAHNPFIYFNF